MGEGGRYLTRLGETIEEAIWREDLSELPALRAWPLRALRIGHALVNDLLEGQLTLRAMSLVYTTLLSLVPLLAVSFSVLKGFGVHNQIEPLLLRFLAPLGERGAEIAENTIGFVDNVRVGILGSLGLALLLYTVVSLIQKIERAFNYTWHTRQTRSVGQRFSNYLSVVMVGPVLMFAALGITASLSSAAIVQRLAEVEVLGGLIQLMGQLVPYLLVIVAFTFVYMFVPNAKVRLGPALVGGVVAGVLWETLGFGFASVVASSARYTAIYSGFAVLILFMMWLYVSWLTLLVGASIAFYVQHPMQLSARREDRVLSGRLKEKLALLLMTRIGRDHFAGRPAGTLGVLAQWSGVAIDMAEAVLHPLERRGLLVRTAGPELAYVPGRAPELITVAEILRAVRTAEETSHPGAPHLLATPGVEKLVASIERAVSESLHERTLRELVMAEAGQEADLAKPDAAKANLKR
jgi:membrane protein